MSEEKGIGMPTEEERDKDAGEEQAGTCENVEKSPEAKEEATEEAEESSGSMEAEPITFLPKGSEKWVKKPIEVRAVCMENAFTVKTLEGVLTGQPGDYLIEGIEGELYPCKPAIFLATYTRS